LLRRWGQRIVPVNGNEALTIDAIGAVRAQPDRRRHHDFRRDELRAIGHHRARNQPRVSGTAGHQYTSGDAAAVEFLRQRLWFPASLEGMQGMMMYYDV